MSTGGSAQRDVSPCTEIAHKNFLCLQLENEWEAQLNEKQDLEKISKFCIPYLT